MARYIDADKLTDKLEELQFNAPVMTPVMKIYNVIELVEDQPTADVVEVVRCKDCKYFMEYANEGKVEGADGDCFIRMSYSLDHQFYAVKCDDFCGYGERKENE